MSGKTSHSRIIASEKCLMLFFVHKTDEKDATITAFPAS
jgi:hypothetical protein